MNPYVINPKFVTLGQAKSALKWFDIEIATLVAHNAQAVEAAEATMAVLVQTHPDLKQDLDMLAFGYRIEGDTEKALFLLQQMRSQFAAYLPVAIKQQLP